MTMGKPLSRALWVVLLVALAASPTLADQPARVGEPEPLSIASEHPYPAGAGLAARAWVVFWPGATYIRVHFSRFDLAPGDFVEVANSDGSESYTYDGKGPHGSGEFWSFSIQGDTAVLRLQASFGGGYGLQVDGFGRGTVPMIPLEPAVPESVCGGEDWKDAKCYQSTRPTEYERGRGSVLALIGCCTACTGFKASDDGQFMTNNHCISTTSGAQSTELRFEYQSSGCPSGTSGYTGAVMGNRVLKTDSTLDYTLFTTTGDSSPIPCLQIDNRLAPAGERIYIAGHPSGGVKKLSIESDMDAGGSCRVDASPYAGNDPTSDIAYYCDTTNGSSGSPVLSGDTHKVVAIHHFGGCLNSGVRMDRIYSQISGLLGTCSDGGGSPNCGNGVKETGEDCDGADLGAATCQSLGYAGGVLACTSSCAFDTSSCGGTCVPVSKARCNCDGACQAKERRYVAQGGVCSDCP